MRTCVILSLFLCIICIITQCASDRASREQTDNPPRGRPEGNTERPIGLTGRPPPTQQPMPINNHRTSSPGPMTDSPGNRATQPPSVPKTKPKPTDGTNNGISSQESRLPGNDNNKLPSENRATTPTRKPELQSVVNGGSGTRRTKPTEEATTNTIGCNSAEGFQKFTNKRREKNLKTVCVLYPNNSSKADSRTDARAQCLGMRSGLWRPQTAKDWQSMNVPIGGQGVNSVELSYWLGRKKTKDGKCIALNEKGVELSTSCTKKLHYGCQKRLQMFTTRPGNWSPKAKHEKNWESCSINGNELFCKKKRIKRKKTERKTE